MATQFKHLQLRRATAFDWTFDNPVLLEGEPGLETDTNKLKLGDGSTVWNSLPYFSSGGGGGGAGCVSCFDFENITAGDNSFAAAPENTFECIGIGYYTAEFSTDSYGSVFVGNYAGNNLGDTNSDVYVGWYCGGDNPNTGGSSFGNVGVGTQTLGTIHDGGQNTVIGSYAGYYLTDGWLNTFIGSNAGWDCTTGENNTVVGNDAGLNLTTGSDNVFLGYFAGYNIETGNFNIIIGSQDFSLSTTSSYTLMIDTDGHQPADSMIYGQMDARVLRTQVNSFAVRCQTGTKPGTITTDADDSFRIDRSTTAGQTRMLIYDVDNATLERVTVGAADSGGSGFKVLRIPN